MVQYDIEGNLAVGESTLAQLLSFLTAVSIDNQSRHLQTLVWGAGLSGQLA